MPTGIVGYNGAFRLTRNDMRIYKSYNYPFFFIDPPWQLALGSINGLFLFQHSLIYSFNRYLTFPALPAYSTFHKVSFKLDTRPSYSSLKRELLERFLKRLRARHCDRRILSGWTILSQIQVRVWILIRRRKMITTDELISTEQTEILVHRSRRW